MKNIVFILAIFIASCGSVGLENNQERRMQTIEILERQKRTGEHLDSILKWQHQLLDTLRTENKIKTK
jgi:hypothetical protein